MPGVIEVRFAEDKDAILLLLVLLLQCPFFSLLLHSKEINRDG